MNADKAFLDTNVLIYVFDHDDPVKTQRAQAVLEHARPGELALSPQVMGEFFVTATRKLARPLEPATASEALEWMSLLEVVPLDREVVRAAVETSRSAQISYWDGLIVAAAEAGGCTRLLTEDLNDGQTIGSVRIENPFRS
jgi:predicted nucleic acid-binding protein